MKVVQWWRERGRVRWDIRMLSWLSVTPDTEIHTEIDASHLAILHLIAVRVSKKCLQIFQKKPPYRDQ